jgi:hypothetical protein
LLKCTLKVSSIGQNDGMAKFIRVGTKIINLEQINHLDSNESLGGAIGRGAGPSGQQIPLVIYFGSGERLAVPSVEEARTILEALRPYMT